MHSKCVRESWIRRWRKKRNSNEKSLFCFLVVVVLVSRFDFEHNQTDIRTPTKQWPLKLAHRSIYCVSGSCAQTSISLPHMERKPKYFCISTSSQRQYKSILNEIDGEVATHDLQARNYKPQLELQTNKKFIDFSGKMKTNLCSLLVYEYSASFVGNIEIGWCLAQRTIPTHGRGTFFRHSTQSGILKLHLPSSIGS